MKTEAVVVDHECVTPLTAGWHGVDQAAMPRSCSRRTKGDTRHTADILPARRHRRELGSQNRRP